MHLETLDRLRWLWPTLVLAAAALLRFVALDHPTTLVFDELFYVRDAISQLVHGYATSWPDSEPDMSGERATAFGDDASYVAHPPLGKWLIGLGVLVFGPESAWGWRFASALAGVATVAVTMRLGWLMSRSLLIACLAGVFLAFDGIHIVMSRVALLDGFLTFAVMLGALCVWRDHVADRSSMFRPWLMLAAVAFGAAAGIKWSGLYPFAAFLVFTVVRDIVTGYRREAERPLRRATLRAIVTGVTTLPTALLTYAATWSGWIFTSGGWGRDAASSWVISLAEYHSGLFAWHASLTAEHPYQSHPLGWPLSLRPTAMYHARWPDGAGCSWAEGCIAGITPIPNPIVTWGGVVALVVLALICAGSLRRPRVANPWVSASSFVIVGYLSGWLPWVLTFSRSAVFQFYTVVLTPFTALALALLLGVVAGARVQRWRAVPTPDPEPSFVWPAAPELLRGRRLTVALIAGAAVVVGLWFFPLWSAIPVPQWFWDLHLWLPGWG